MPIFVHPSGKKVLYIHVPKTGGTYLEDLLSANGFTRHFWMVKRAQYGLRVSPQHWHSQIYEKVFDLKSFEMKFMSVRNPIDRIISDYRNKMKRDEFVSLSEWLDEAAKKLDIDPSYKDNHLRPQVEFYVPGLWIFKAESFFGERWAASASAYLGIQFEHLTVKQRRNTQSEFIDLDEHQLKRAVDFCMEIYQEDFKFFNYKPWQAKVFAGPTSAPARVHALHMRSSVCSSDVRVVPDGSVMPVQNDFGEPKMRFGRAAGVYSRHGEVCHSSITCRNSMKLFNEGVPNPKKSLERRCVYAGLASAHFGHFLLEGLSRLWYLSQASDDEALVVWAARSHTEKSRHLSNLLPWQREILSVLGIRNECLILREETVFREVIVPDAKFEIPDFFHPVQEAFLSSGLIRRKRNSNLKLWLSRSRLVGRGKTQGVDELERRLSANKWTVIHPQELSVKDQLEMISQADRVAGEEGSAFHSLVLLSDIEDLKVDILPRSGNLSQTYWTIAEVKGFEQRLINVGPSEIVEKSGRTVTKSITGFDDILQQLD